MFIQIDSQKIVLIFRLYSALFKLFENIVIIRLDSLFHFIFFKL